MLRWRSDHPARAGIARGGAIEGVVVATHRDAGGGVEHVPYLLPSWRRGYIAIALFRGPGVRAWRDLDRLLQFLRKGMAFRLPISLHEEDCPRLTRLRSVLPHGTTGHRTTNYDAALSDEDSAERPPFE